MANEIQNNITKARLDMQTLEQRALHLPEGMRELFVWLGCYTAQECSRDVDILTDRFKELGFNHDKTTWNKILRGMWQHDAHGNPTNAPCLAEDKFVKAVNALKNAARIKEIGGRVPFVMTATAQSIFDFVEIRRAPDRVNKFGIIIGETGSQKTAALKQYCRENNHVACVIVEAPETPSMNQFMTDLAKCFNFNAQSGYLRKKIYVLDAVNARKTIIVENIQRLYDARCGDRQPIFSFLQKLQEDTNCTVIMSFTPTFEKTFTNISHRGFFEQFEGRAGGGRKFLRLPPFPPEDDVLMIAKAFGLQHADKHSAELVKICHEPGRIRRLFDDLQDAKIAAEAAKEKLTIQHIRDARGEE
jgi:hypothetical protein